MRKNIAGEKFNLEDIFEDGWGVFKAIFAKCAPIAIGFGFITNLLVLLTVAKIPFDAWAARIAAMAPDGAARDADLLALKLQIRFTATANNFFTYLVFSVAMLAIAKCAERFITQRQISAGEALSEGVRRWPRYLWTAFLSGLIIMGLSCLLIVPGLIWTVYYLFVPYVVAMTSLSGKQALDYSKSLVRGAFWNTLGYFIAIGIATAIPTMILSLALQTAANLVTSSLPAAAAVAVEALVNAPLYLINIFQIALCTVFFLNRAYLARERGQAANEDEQPAANG